MRASLFAVVFMFAVLADSVFAGAQEPGNAGTRPVPTHADVKYGAHDRNLMDVWTVDADRRSPILVHIHGGGFRGGNKRVPPALLHAALAEGLSVVAITYRLSGEAIAPAQFEDCARAIQFIRHKASEWGMDPQRMAAMGNSAGAGLSLWLAFHDDMADPDHEDPVRRESTRLLGAMVFNGQTSYDPRFIRDLFPQTDTYRHTALAQLFDVDMDELDDLPEEKYRLFEEVSAMTHLTRDDPPVLLAYSANLETPITNQSVGIHHPRFAQVLQEKMDSLGIECRVETNIRANSPEMATMFIEFAQDRFGRQ